MNLNPLKLRRDQCVSQTKYSDQCSCECQSSLRVTKNCERRGGKKQVCITPSGQNIPHGVISETPLQFCSLVSVVFSWCYLRVRAGVEGCDCESDRCDVSQRIQSQRPNM